MSLIFNKAQLIWLAKVLEVTKSDEIFISDYQEGKDHFFEVWQRLSFDSSRHTVIAKFILYPDGLGEEIK